jgi:SAM-dependent methyltransferase
MRRTYREVSSKEYWETRWSNVDLDSQLSNLNVYPLKYAEMVVGRSDGAILEVGCGAGRVLRYYHNREIKITGIDYIQSVVDRLKNEDTTLDVRCGDICNLEYSDGTFNCVLAFGVYHNLDDKVHTALTETARVLRPEGKLCASFRADNWQTRLNDWIEDVRRTKNRKVANRVFHKLNLKKNEFEKLLVEHDFSIEEIFPVVNMPILYKFRLFRFASHKNFNEELGRKEGYRLNTVGKVIQRVLMAFFPDQFCNVYVCIARRC